MTTRLSDAMTPHEAVTYFFERAAGQMELDEEMRDRRRISAAERSRPL
jgi:hypothetical protein